MNLKSGSEITQGHRKWYHSIDCVWFPISVLRNIVHKIVYDFLLVFFSNFVPKMHRFWDIRLQKCRDLENRVRVRQGHWKCRRSTERIWLPIDVL